METVGDLIKPADLPLQSFAASEALKPADLPLQRGRGTAGEKATKSPTKTGVDEVVVNLDDTIIRVCSNYHHLSHKRLRRRSPPPPSAKKRKAPVRGAFPAYCQGALGGPPRFEAITGVHTIKKERSQ